jgi:predicted amidohydrolase YtcJ
LNKYHADYYIDAKTRPVYPGFIDGHCHILSYGMSLLSVDLKGCTSWEEVVERTKKFYHKNKPNVILGRGWDQTMWKDKKFPTNELLNKYFPDVPVMLTRIDGHAVIVNHYLIDRAGINENSIAKGGQFISENGRLTGVLIDNAIDVVSKLIPEPDEKTLEKALMLADENCIGMGLTTLEDAGIDQRTLDKIISLQKEGKFKSRVYAMMMLNDENLDHWLKKGPTKIERTYIRSFKIVADGALGSRGACLKYPYSDISHHHGQLLADTTYYVDAVKRLFNAGFQVNTHCIGDSANKFMLSLYSRTVSENPDHRWRIEHAQVLDTNDFFYFNNFGIIPSVQPSHAVSDGDWAEKRIGKSRMKGAYAYKTLLNYVAFMVLGTDFPIEDINPLRTFYTAVFRKEMNGKPENGYHPEEGLSRMEALKGMTIWAALGSFEENEKGTLEPGKMADFVILSNDILTVSEEALRHVYVMNTIINGEPIYSYE